MTAASFTTRRLTPSDLSQMDALMELFADVFDAHHIYRSAIPSADYTSQLLARDDFFAVVAIKQGAVIGGLCAYQLTKFEQARSEIFIYDLAVAATDRRQGVATAMIDEVRSIAERRGVYLIFIQAERDNDAAIALYSKLGRREDAVHFEIAVNR